MECEQKELNQTSSISNTHTHARFMSTHIYTAALHTDSSE